MLTDDRRLRVLFVVLLFAAYAFSRSHGILLGDAFSLSGDEFNTYRDAHPATSQVEFSVFGRTTYFLLTRELIELFGYSDFVLRVLPFVLSLVSFPVFYLLIERLYGHRIAAIFLVLLTFLPEHLYYSGLARHYGAAFPFVGVFLLLNAQTIRDGTIPGGRILLMGLAALAATLFHITSLVPILAALCFTAARETIRAYFSDPARLKWYGIAAAVIGMVLLFVGARFFEHLGGLARIDPDVGRAVYMVASALFAVTLPVALLAGLSSLKILWDSRDVDVAFYLFVVAVSYSVIFFVAILHEQAAHGGQYLFTVLFAFVMLAAIGINAIGEACSAPRDGMFVSYLICGLLVTTQLLALFDHFRDGDRLNYKAAVEIVERDADPMDVVFSREIAATDLSRAGLYSRTIESFPFPGVFRRKFTDDSYVAFSRYVDFERACRRAGTIWFVAENEFSYWKEDSPLTSLVRKVDSVGVTRFNHHNNVVDVYRVAAPPCPD